MFGYVRPLQGELKVWELEAYQGAYCGLCHALGRRYGLFARLLLNYDFTMLAILLSPRADRPALERRRCIRCPMRGKKVCSANRGGEIAADESIILTWWKLQDGIQDGSGWEKLRFRVLALLLHRSYRKAASACPDFDAQVRECLSQLHFLEKENCPSLDRTADLFARILRGAAPATGEDARDRAMGQLLYHVGRWIYLVDAWDDLEEDRRTGNYNPILARFRGETEEQKEYLRMTLDRSLELALSASRLLELGCWTGVMENILSMGLPTVEEAVFQGRWGRTEKAAPRHPKSSETK